MGLLRAEGYEAPAARRRGVLQGGVGVHRRPACRYARGPSQGGRRPRRSQPLRVPSAGRIAADGGAAAPTAPPWHRRRTHGADGPGKAPDPPGRRVGADGRTGDGPDRLGRPAPWSSPTGPWFRQDLDRLGLALAHLPQTRLCASVTGSCNLLLSVGLRGTREVGTFDALLAERMSELRVRGRTVALRTAKRMGRIRDRQGRAVRNVPLRVPRASRADRQEPRSGRGCRHQAGPLRTAFPPWGKRASRTADGRGSTAHDRDLDLASSAARGVRPSEPLLRPAQPLGFQVRRP
ncbi:hypothetical protein S1361_37495 [Streptomyces cyanogenus]|uniref:Uncharacterized protein n=1 Tax=Streptomyces cyanogenus TaxID=80860 RepID=A0ABX7U239_STRCY|nr:hypothetical protein S1361_37495 [Streptomyces cyanogenus]